MTLSALGSRQQVRRAVACSEEQGEAEKEELGGSTTKPSDDVCDRLQLKRSVNCRRMPPDEQTRAGTAVMDHSQTHWKAVVKDRRNSECGQIGDSRSSCHSDATIITQSSLLGCVRLTRRFFNEAALSTTCGQTSPKRSETQNTPKLHVGSFPGAVSTRMDVAGLDRGMPTVAKRDAPPLKGDWWCSTTKTITISSAPNLSVGVKGHCTDMKQGCLVTPQLGPAVSKNATTKVSNFSPKCSVNSFQDLCVEELPHLTKVGDKERQVSAIDAPKLPDAAPSASLSLASAVLLESVSDGNGGRQMLSGSVHDAWKQTSKPSVSNMLNDPSIDVSREGRSSVQKRDNMLTPLSLTLSLFSTPSSHSDKASKSPMNSWTQANNKEDDVGRVFSPADTDVGKLVKMDSLSESCTTSLKPLAPIVKQGTPKRANAPPSDHSRRSPEKICKSSFQVCPPNKRGCRWTKSVLRNSFLSLHAKRAEKGNIPSKDASRWNQEEAPSQGERSRVGVINADNVLPIIRALPVSSSNNRIPDFSEVKRRCNPAAFRSIMLSRSTVAVAGADALEGVSSRLLQNKTKQQQQQQHNADRSLGSGGGELGHLSRVSSYVSNADVSNPDATQSFMPLAPFGLNNGDSIGECFFGSWMHSVCDESSVDVGSSRSSGF